VQILRYNITEQIKWNTWHISEYEKTTWRFGQNS